MEANPRRLKDLFGPDVRFVVPIFQRPYKWEREKQWEPLWEDLLELTSTYLAGDEVPDHFLGAVVLDQLLTATGALTARQVIDGQQRLTTLQLVIAAAADAAAERGFERHDRALRKFIRNEDELEEGYESRFKVWPTTADRDAFRLAVERSADDVRKAHADRPSRILDAYLFFYDKVMDWLDEGAEEAGATEERIDALVRIMRDSLVVVAIDLKNHDNAQAIFETLNDRGTPLNPSDLVKNLLFQLAMRERADAEELHERYWKSLIDDYWQEERRQGRIKRPTLDLFLGHYLTHQLRQELRSQRLYSAFQRWARGDSGLTAEAHMERLSYFAGLYRTIDEGHVDGRERTFLDRLRVIETTTAHPVLLELYARREGAELETARLVAALEAIESYLTRRMLSWVTAKNYNTVFLELLRDLHESDAPADEIVIRFLSEKTTESTRWPDDREITEKVLSNKTYGGINHRRIAMVLTAVEGHLTEQDRFTESIDYSDLTVEHLMPQKWEEHWPLPRVKDERDERDERNQLVNTFGNLTLITGRLNASISNGPWPAKREAILRHSALSMNRSLPEDWTEKEMRERGNDLARAICEVWPSADQFRERLLDPAGE